MPRAKKKTQKLAVHACACAILGHGLVEDQAAAARPILEEAADLHVAAPLACACRYAVLRPNDVSGRAAPMRHHPIMRLGCT